jgi:hypothetical protein
MHIYMDTDKDMDTDMVTDEDVDMSIQNVWYRKIVEKFNSIYDIMWTSPSSV